MTKRTLGSVEFYNVKTPQAKRLDDTQTLIARPYLCFEPPNSIENFCYKCGGNLIDEKVTADLTCPHCGSKEY